jgi:hypothetical protein
MGLSVHARIPLSVILFLGLLVTSVGSEAAPLAGQVIVDPANPAWLKYAGGGPFFMVGPGDPEGFLYLGSRNSDGTRNGNQMSLIDKMVGTGANCIYLMAVRSHGGDGDSTQNPFVGSDPTNVLDEDILDQWETWFTQMDNNGIVIYFFFYDDNIRVANNLGWYLDGSGNLHPQEQYFIETIVNRFEHHKHLIWAVMEEVQEMGSDYVRHAKKIAEVIRQTDDHDHVIGVHKLNGLSFSEFADDPVIDQFAIQYNVSAPSSLHNGMVSAWNNAAGRYNLNMSEWESSTGSTGRRQMWAIAMGGAHVMLCGWTISNNSVSDLQNCGRLVDFMESTDINEMAPHDELAFGGTLYVLANPGDSYIAYASSLSGDMGLKGMTAGSYDLKWYDVTNGATVIQEDVVVGSGDQTWTKPGSIGNELALYVKRVSSVPDPPPEAPTDLQIIYGD